MASKSSCLLRGVACSAPPPVLLLSAAPDLAEEEEETAMSSLPLSLQCCKADKKIFRMLAFPCCKYTIACFFYIVVCLTGLGGQRWRKRGLLPLAAAKAGGEPSRSEAWPRFETQFFFKAGIFFYTVGWKGYCFYLL